MLNFPGVGRRRTAKPDAGTSCSCAGTVGFVVAVVVLDNGGGDEVADGEDGPLFETSKDWRGGVACFGL